MFYVDYLSKCYNFAVVILQNVTRLGINLNVRVYMKKIEAIIRKTRFDDVKEALLAADIEWFSYYDVRGEGKMRQARIFRGVMYDTSSIERVLINIVVRDKNVEKTVAAVQKAARTGEIGDGRIFIIPVEDSIRIRTGERGDIALYNAEQEK
jgi:nitrogen regulatory protein P-II 1